MVRLPVMMIEDCWLMKRSLHEGRQQSNSAYAAGRRPPDGSVLLTTIRKREGGNRIGGVVAGCAHHYAGQRYAVLACVTTAT
jgi:hypothetical protein